MMNLSITLFFLHLSFTNVFTEDSKLASVKSSAFGNDPEVMSEVRDPKKDAETVCKAFNAKPEETKVNLTGKMEYEDMLRLMTWKLKYKLESGRTSVKIDKKLNRKRNIVEMVASIFKTGCPSKYVPKGFVSIAKVLFIIYLNSVENATDTNQQQWLHTFVFLDRCHHTLHNSLKLVSKGSEVAYLVLKDDKGKEEKVEVLPPEEALDFYYNLDVIIDAVWWMFSFSFARCYPFMDNKSVDLAQYKRLFFNDFLSDDLLNRWKYGGRWRLAYGPIFGDIDIATVIRNARLCVTAAYTESAIVDRQLVRPLSTYKDSKMSNRKTGELMV